MTPEPGNFGGEGFWERGGGCGDAWGKGVGSLGDSHFSFDGLCLVGRSVENWVSQRGDRTETSQQHHESLVAGSLVSEFRLHHHHQSVGL